MENVRVLLGSWMVANGYDRMKPVQKSKDTGYLFVSFISTSNPNSNQSVWFGREASASFKEGDMVNPHALWVLFTENANGQERIKLTNKEGDAGKTLEKRGFVAVDLSSFSAVKLIPTQKPISKSEFDIFVDRLKNETDDAPVIDAIKASTTLSQVQKDELLAINA